MTKKDELPLGYLTLPQAKALLRSTIGHVRQLAQDGKLDYVRDNNKAIIGVSKAQVEKMVPPKAPRPPKVIPIAFDDSEGWGK